MLFHNFLTGTNRKEKKIFDTRGTTIFFAQRISSQVTKQLKVSLSTPVLVYQALGGEHQNLDYSAFFSMSYSF